MLFAKWYKKGKIMGLDMMLYRKRLSDPDNEKEIMYWRKANAIHEWFVQNVQNGMDECNPHEVTQNQILELRNLCQEVLEDYTVAEELLPTTQGFFFGSTEYDEWYFMNLKSTVDAFDEILEDSEADDIFIYQSSW